MVGQSCEFLKSLLLLEKGKPPVNGEGESLQDVLGVHILRVFKDGKHHWVGKKHVTKLVKAGYQITNRAHSQCR